MTKRLLLAGAMLAGGSAALCAQQDPRIDSVFAAWNRTDGPGCIAGVRHNGNLVHLKAYGMANLEYGVPLSAESISESGSVAKQFTAAALLLLEQQGKLSLDDDIRKHIPEIPDFGARITLRHLLTHTSGLRDQWALLSMAGWPPGTQVHSIEQIVHLISRQKQLNFPPGEFYLYSNTGYTLLAAVVKRVTGQSLADWSRQHLFQPLGMRNTQWRDDFRKVVPGRATAYSRGPGGGAWVQDMPFTRVYGNGGLLTTVPDLLVWNDALTAGTAPLTRELVLKMETPMRLNDRTEIGYALGLGVGQWRGVRQVSHGGATAGYRTFLTRFPERNLSIAVLCNAGNANAGGYSDQVAMKLLQPGDHQPPGAPVAIAAGELAPLAGVWRDTLTDRLLTFSIQNGQLAVTGGGPVATLTHLGNLRFWHFAAGSFQFLRRGNDLDLVQSADGNHRYGRQVPIDTAAVRLADYAGRYWSDELEVGYDIAVHEGRLTASRAWEEPTWLSPIYTDGFAAPGRTVRFVRDAAGRVTGMRVYAGRAIDLRFTRVHDRENGK